MRGINLEIKSKSAALEIFQLKYFLASLKSASNEKKNYSNKIIAPKILELYSDHSICSAVTFHPSGNSNHALVLASIDFLLNS